MFEQLGDFSKSVSMQIEMRFPEWTDLAQIEENDGNYALAITVQPSSKAISYPLRIDTWGKKLLYPLIAIMRTSLSSKTVLNQMR
jgi:hypothetical protein